MEDSKRWEAGFDDSERQVIKRDVIHFTDMPEMQSFLEVKVNKNDNVYGVTWANVVKEYLKTAYSAEGSQADVVALGVTYKVLRRSEVTAFYDTDGNTLFDVENKRLEKEYRWIMKDSVQTDTDIETSEEDYDDKTEEENTDLEKKEADSEIGEASGEKSEEKTSDSVLDDDVVPMCETEESVKGLEAPTEDEIKSAKEETARSAKQSAKEKLEKERKDAKDKMFAEPVIGYLLKRCEEDEGLSQDVVQKHKTWIKCFDYIYEQARKQAKGNRCAVRDDVVYEWAEDYYHRDDKAEEEKKAKEAEEKKKKEDAKKKEKAEKVKKESTSKGNNARATTLKNGMDNHKHSKEKTAAKAEKEAQKPQSKKNNKDMDGQMDLFSFISM